MSQISCNEADQEIVSKAEIMKKLYQDIEQNTQKFLRQINESTGLLYENDKLDEDIIFETRKDYINHDDK